MWRDKYESIYVLDKNNGVLFNHRRQSRDAFLVENIVSKVKQENGTFICIRLF